MKASELRINNWYYGDALGGGYEQITAKEILDFFDDPLDDYYQPIPLTEEWLLKFGFVAKNEGYLCSNKKVYLSDDFYYYCLYFDCEDVIEIKYVHSLQNLYFALTGEELKIEL